MDENTELTTPETEKRRPGRPRTRPEESGEVPPAPVANTPKVSVKDRLRAALAPRSSGKSMSGDEYRKAAEQRMQEVEYILVNKEVDRRPEGIYRQCEFEAKHLLNGTWVPGQKAPRGRQAEVTESIMGGVRTPDRNSNPGEARVDAMLPRDEG